MRRWVSGTLVLALAFAGGSASAEPGEPARAAADAGGKRAEPVQYRAQVLVLYASNQKKGVDPAIGQMPELKQPPFSAYDSYELLNKLDLPLAKGDPKTADLPNGRILKTALLDVLPNDYVRISASINQPKGKDFLPLLEVKAKAGQHFIVAGQSYKAGILVLVIRVLR